MGAENVVVMGIPYDHNSSFLRGAAAAPEKIQEAFYSPSANLWAENGINLEGRSHWKTIFDLETVDPTAAFEKINKSLTVLLEKQEPIISLGGDHSITYPIIEAYAQKYPDLTILHLDAHPDTYHDFQGNPFSHASPFARIMEKRLVKRLVQVGIRTMTGHQKDQAQRFGVEVIAMNELHKASDLAFDGPLYLSLDMDCLDPAFAPGVSHHEPGGMSTRQVLQIIQNLKTPLVGADIVEVNPKRDLNGVTAMVAAKLLKEILAKMVGG